MRPPDSNVSTFCALLSAVLVVSVRRPAAVGLAGSVRLTTWMPCSPYDVTTA